MISFLSGIFLRKGLGEFLHRAVLWHSQVKHSTDCKRSSESPNSLSPILIFDIYSTAVSNPYIFNSKKKSHTNLSEMSLLEAPVNSCSEQLVWESVDSASHPLSSAWRLTRLNTFKCRSWNTYRWRWVFEMFAFSFYNLFTRSFPMSRRLEGWDKETAIGCVLHIGTESNKPFLVIPTKNNWTLSW